jgi:hypothetical protein
LRTQRETLRFEVGFRHIAEDVLVASKVPREEQILWLVTSQGFLRGIASSDVQKGVRMPLR